MTEENEQKNPKWDQADLEENAFERLKKQFIKLEKELKKEQERLKSKLEKADKENG